VGVCCCVCWVWGGGGGGGGGGGWWWRRRRRRTTTISHNVMHKRKILLLFHFLPASPLPLCLTPSLSLSISPFAAPLRPPDSPAAACRHHGTRRGRNQVEDKDSTDGYTPDLWRREIEYVCVIETKGTDTPPPSEEEENEEEAAAAAAAEEEEQQQQKEDDEDDEDDEDEDEEAIST